MRALRHHATDCPSESTEPKPMRVTISAIESEDDMNQAFAIRRYREDAA